MIDIAGALGWEVEVRGGKLFRIVARL